MAKPPTDLIEAFRVEADRDVESIAVLLIEDGFEVAIMRVLAAWPQIEHEWLEPKHARPDDGLPTAAAWRWLVSGLAIDYGDLAAAAGVDRATARAKLKMLLGCRLVLPDGTLSKTAHVSLQEHAKRALKLKSSKAAARAAPRDDGGAN